MSYRTPNPNPDYLLTLQMLGARLAGWCCEFAVLGGEEVCDVVR